MTSHYTVYIIVGVCLVAALLGAGCTQPMASAYSPGSTQTMDTKTERLDPAAVYCGQVGGTPTTVKNADGSEYGVCAFPNTTECDDEALFRGEGCRPVAAPNADSAQ
ncbi:MAG TPA: DUF333 domain-containing protein [Methanoregula sp.]|nr:DUF333 domain-containing protein [Methanoregula sp.]